MFIGRERELDFLEDQYNGENGKLVFLYGRRRVGKTETLKQFSKDKPHVLFSCAQKTNEMLLAEFSSKMLKENLPASNYISMFKDWDQALASIADLPYGDKKKLVIIDEFPYLCKVNNSVPSILQNLWDNNLKDKNVMLVLCGSAMSFIEKEILAEKNPLYGRATGIYKMDELSFQETAKFFPNYSPEEKVLTYSILGGIPHYLIQFDSKLSLEENIKQKILTKGCILYSEVEFILHQELRETSVYNVIIQAIALGANSLSEISQKSLLNDTAKTSTYLSNLEELGIISREFSIDTSQKGKGNRNKGYYCIKDSFFRFWYAFVDTNLSDLEDGYVDDVYEYDIKGVLHNYASSAFENVCKSFIKEQRAKKNLPFRYKSMGRWFGKTSVRDISSPTGIRKAETEVDILAISEDKKKYLVGECKFKNKLFQYSEYLDTIAKFADEQKNAEFFYALFSLTGFDSKIIEKAKEDNHLMLFDIDSVVGK